MNRKIGDERGLEMIADMVQSGIDIQGLTEKYGVDREDLARWMLTERTQRMLAGLCMLSDYQTQLLLSHHRVTALSRLVRMVQSEKAKDNAAANDGGAGNPAEPPLDPDLVRKACVDLLRLNMARLDSDASGRSEKPEKPATPGDVLRKLMYGDEAEDPRPDGEPSKPVGT